MLRHERHDEREQNESDQAGDEHEGPPSEDREERGAQKRRHKTPERYPRHNDADDQGGHTTRRIGARKRHRNGKHDPQPQRDLTTMVN